MAALSASVPTYGAHRSEPDDCAFDDVPVRRQRIKACDRSARCTTAAENFASGMCSVLERFNPFSNARSQRQRNLGAVFEGYRPCRVVLDVGSCGRRIYPAASEAYGAGKPECDGQDQAGNTSHRPTVATDALRGERDSALRCKATGRFRQHGQINMKPDPLYPPHAPQTLSAGLRRGLSCGVAGR